MMEQLSLQFGFHRGDQVKVLSKSIGGVSKRHIGGVYKIREVRVCPDGWGWGTKRQPKIGTTYYLIGGSYFLAEDLRRVR